MPEYRINVVVDPSRAIAGQRRVDAALTATSARADRLRSLLTRTFAVLGGAAAAVSVVRTLANFGQAMSTVRAITQATNDEFEQLREKAKQLGAETRFSASQAAEGMIFLARAGFDTGEVLGTIEGTLQLAQAGALELGSAADIASNVLKGFRLEVDQTGRVVDVLAFAANNSNTTVLQLGEALKFVGPVAAGLGISLEETAAAIGNLSDAGLQASLAGTGLRRVLSELEAPTDASREVLARLGVAADDVQVSQVGLTQALKVLADAGITTADALQIFGQRGGPAFEVLVNSIPGVEQMTVALNEQEDTARRIATVMDDNLNGALLATKSAIEAVVLAFGDLGAGNALTRSFQALASVLRFVARNLELISQAGIALGIALATPKLQAIAAGFIAAGRATNIFTAGLVGARVAARLLLRAFAIGIIIEGVQLAITHFERWRFVVDPLIELFRLLARAVGVAVDAIGNALGDFARWTGLVSEAQAATMGASESTERLGQSTAAAGAAFVSTADATLNMAAATERVTEATSAATEEQERAEAIADRIAERADRLANLRSQEEQAVRAIARARVASAQATVELTKATVTSSLERRRAILLVAEATRNEALAEQAKLRVLREGTAESVRASRAAEERAHTSRLAADAAEGQARAAEILANANRSVSTSNLDVASSALAAASSLDTYSASAERATDRARTLSAAQSRAPNFGSTNISGTTGGIDLGDRDASGEYEYRVAVTRGGLRVYPNPNYRPARDERGREPSSSNIHITQNIHTPDADSFRRSSRQVARRTESAFERIRS